jgi:transposase
VVSAANANDATMLEAVLDDIPPVRMPTGRRRRRPTKVHADKAYDHRRCRAYLRRRGIRPRIARRMIEPSDRLGRHRWRIERTGAWLGGWRRLRIRYERSSERFYALAMLACSVICFNALRQESPNGCGRQRPWLYQLGGEGRLLRPHLHPAHSDDTAHAFEAVELLKLGLAVGLQPGVPGFGRKLLVEPVELVLELPLPPRQGRDSPPGRGVLLLGHDLPAGE